VKHVLFIQGGAEGAHDEDAKLVASLRRELGSEYSVRYPRMPKEEEPDYRAWARVIENEMEVAGDRVVLVGHSIGASVLIKYLTAGKPQTSAAGIFLIATPFWHDHEIWHWPEVELSEDVASRLPRRVPIRFYHGRADETVPFEHLAMYARAIPQASVLPLDGRNHQLNEDLSRVGSDIKELG